MTSPLSWPPVRLGDEVLYKAHSARPDPALAYELARSPSSWATYKPECRVEVWRHVLAWLRPCDHQGLMEFVLHQLSVLVTQGLSAYQLSSWVLKSPALTDRIASELMGQPVIRGDATLAQTLWRQTRNVYLLWGWYYAHSPHSLSAHRLTPDPRLATQAISLAQGEVLIALIPSFQGTFQEAVHLSTLVLAQ